MFSIFVISFSYTLKKCLKKYLPPLSTLKKVHHMFLMIEFKKFEIEITQVKTKVSKFLSQMSNQFMVLSIKNKLVLGISFGYAITWIFVVRCFFSTWTYTVFGYLPTVQITQVCKISSVNIFDCNNNSYDLSVQY